MKKKIMALILAFTLTLGCTETASAVTPPLTVNMPKIPEITVKLPESLKDAIRKAAQKYINEHPVNVDAPDDADSGPEEAMNNGEH